MLTILFFYFRSDEILVNSIKHNFPYLKVTSHKQVSFLYNVLQILKYQPQIRVDLLQIVIDKLIAIDVHAPREEIIRLEEEPSEKSENMMFEMDVDELGKSKKMKHPIADTFDVMMELIFKYIKDECFKNDQFLWSRCQQLYNELMYIFENVILCTHACHHVQFIIFYICSFEKNLAHEFIKFLWLKVTSPSVPPVIRQTSVAYLSSYLARANYVGLRYVDLILSCMHFLRLFKNIFFLAVM